MGGSSGDSTPTTYIPPAIIPPLQPELVNAGRAQLAANDQFNPYGSGARLLPQNPFAQVAFPGQQQTIYGQAGFNPANSAPFYGQSGQNQASINQAAGYGGGQTGGSGQSGGGGGQNQALYPHAQQVLAPLQQFFPGIMPQFGVPQASGGGQLGYQAPPQQPQTAPMAQANSQQPEPQQPQPQPQQAPQPQQQAPAPDQKGQEPASQPQQQALSPQDEALQQQWIQAVLAGGGQVPQNFQNGVWT